MSINHIPNISEGPGPPASHACIPKLITTALDKCRLFLGVKTKVWYGTQDLHWGQADSAEVLDRLKMTMLKQCLFLMISGDDICELLGSHTGN